MLRGWLYDLLLTPLEKWVFRPLRTELLSHARGHVLELGIGTGLNLPYYPVGIELTAIEPDPDMLRRARKRALHHPAHLLLGEAESLPFQDAQFDTVVGTLVFCTISNPEKALQEAHRVLKPGGQLLLLEHVRCQQHLLARLLDFLNPFWKYLAMGCHLNRNPEGLLRKIGFDFVTERILWGSLGRFWILRKPFRKKDAS